MSANRTSRRLSRVVGALLGLAMAPITIVGPSTTAGAAPFACLTPTVYIAQGNPTQLFTLSYSPGSASLTPIGPATQLYNGIAFNPSDGLLYAVQNAVSAPDDVIRIDDTGAITSTGVTLPNANYNVGAFLGGLFYVMDANGNPSTLFAVDLASAVVTEIALSTSVSAPDLTPSGGSLWGMNLGGRFVRVDPTTGTVTTFPQSILPATTAGAVWTFGNGNLGISDNVTGTIYQVQITDADSATPTFTLVSQAAGPSTSNNDGTSCQIQSVNLGITKTGPATIEQGGQLTWTLTVRNDSAGVSSGYTITDEVPTSVTGVTTSTPGCTVDSGNAVVCVGGKMQPGEETTITITGTAPATVGTTLTNTATVLGNEDDDSSDNDASSVTTTVVEAGPGGPTSPEQCKRGGWMDFGDRFKNQGDCVSSLMRQR